MAKKQPLSLDYAQGDEVSRGVGLHSARHLSKGQAQWQGIYLETNCQPPLETPEFTWQQHTVTIPRHSIAHIEEVANGKTQTVSCQVGTASFTPAGLSRQYRWLQPIELTHIILEPALIHQVAFESVDPDRIELIPYFVQPNPLVYQICLSLVQEFEANPASSKLYAESAATMLAIHLLRHHSTRHHRALSKEGHPPNHQLDRAIDYIHAHLTDDISLKAIANYLGISRYHLCRMFKRSMGMSPHKYVLQQRVEKAKSMLHEGKLTISDIAIACGFSHQSHFSYHFKRFTGVTPRTFKLSL